MYLTQNDLNPTFLLSNMYCAYIFIALPYLRFLYVSKHKFLVKYQLSYPDAIMSIKILKLQLRVLFLIRIEYHIINVCYIFSQIYHAIFYFLCIILVYKIYCHINYINVWIK